MAIEDPIAHLTPAQRERLKAASGPIGTAKDADRELDLLDQRAAQLTATIKKAELTYRSATSLPEGVDDAARTAVEQAAEAELSGVESAARRELTILHARARSIVSQLDDAASQPNLVAVPPAALAGANQLRPLVESELSGASLAAIGKRMTAATVRDDPSELLALAMVVGPLVAQRQASPDEAGTDEALQRYELRRALRDITSRWRDTSLDGPSVHARTVERALGDLDRTIVDGYQERTGGARYGFLDDFYGAR